MVKECGFEKLSSSGVFTTGFFFFTYFFLRNPDAVRLCFIIFSQTFQAYMGWKPVDVKRIIHLGFTQAGLKIGE